MWDVLHQIFHRNFFDPWEEKKLKIFFYLSVSKRSTIFIVKYFGSGRKKKKILKIEITVLLFSVLRAVLYLFTFFIHLWVCQYIKYIHSYYAIWKSLQHLNFTIRVDVFNEVRLTFERFRLCDRAAWKDKRHQIVCFLHPVIKSKCLPSCV